MSSTLDYWPSIQEAIATNNDTAQENSTAKAQCPICMDDVAVTSFPPVPPREGDNPDIDPTQGLILLCGHVLCMACFKHNEAIGNRWRKCPICRAHLKCTDCGRGSNVIGIPKEGSPSTVPDVAKGDDGGRCADCNSKRWFKEMIEQGEWPNGLADLEPGFVPLFYHVVDKLEAEKKAITKDAVTETFSNIIRSEFKEMIEKRAEAIYNRSVTTGNRWFQNTPASMMRVRTAAPETGEEAMRRRMAHRQQLFLSLRDSYWEELYAMPDRPPRPEEAPMQRHVHRLMDIVGIGRLDEQRIFEDFLQRRRSGNDPAERARAPEEDGDGPGVIAARMGEFLNMQMLQMQRMRSNLAPGPDIGLDGMPFIGPRRPPQAAAQQVGSGVGSVDIADIPRDDAMDTVVANELVEMLGLDGAIAFMNSILEGSSRTR